MSNFDSLEDLLVHELRDIHDAERQIMRALPRMANAASHPDLQRVFEEHRNQTELQVGRIEEALALLGTPVGGGQCEGMAGLLAEATRTINDDATPAVKDTALIAAAQKVEHFEIASYGCVCTYAELLRYDEVHELLGQNLDEEETTDQKLMVLAETVISPQAGQTQAEQAESDR